MTGEAKSTVIVRNNAEAQRFEAVINGLLCHLDYRLDGDVLVVHHTEVPRALEGRGIAAQLVRAAIDHARHESLRIAPHCPYVRSYVRRHPETHDILADAPEGRPD
ncbi:MAG: GNAT family N-acetyltransferase [Casimicrobiaceae bacterium]